MQVTGGNGYLKGCMKLAGKWVPLISSASCALKLTKKGLFVRFVVNTFVVAVKYMETHADMTKRVTLNKKL